MLIHIRRWKTYTLSWWQFLERRVEQYMVVKGYFNFISSVLIFLNDNIFIYYLYNSNYTISWDNLPIDLIVKGNRKMNTMTLHSPNTYAFRRVNKCHAYKTVFPNKIERTFPDTWGKDSHMNFWNKDVITFLHAINNVSKDPFYYVKQLTQEADLSNQLSILQGLNLHFRTKNIYNFEHSW